MPTLKRGDKVINRYGEIRTVLAVCGCRVLVCEECNGWYHPSKLTLMRKAVSRDPA